MRKVLFTLLTTIFISTTLFAEWVPFDKKSASKVPPKVTVISDTESGTILRVELSGIEISEFVSNEKNYTKVDLLNDVFAIEPGNPEIPYIAEILAVPDNVGISIEVLETSEIQTFNNISLPPARMSWYEGDEEPVYDENSRTYQSSDLYPSYQTKLDKPLIFRDFRIARAAIYPVRYNPARKELQVTASMTVRVKYGSGEVVNPKTSPKREIAPTFGQIYRSTILNYDKVLEKNYGGVEAGRDLMLCIMPDEFVASFQIYADWKRESGIDVHVTSFTDIGATASNPQTVKDHITDAYLNWDVPPTYVLIIGDNNIFPKKVITYPDYSFAHDNWFVEIDGGDYIPDLLIGRFTNQGDYRMQVMINKYLNYEKNPYVADPTWFKKGIVASNNAYESQVYVKRETAQNMVDYGFTHVDTMMSDGSYGGTGCTYTISDVTNAINDGRSYLNYRGEGWSSGWNSNCSPVHTSNLSALSNGEKLTFVTSIGCGVAMFDTGGGNCFGEEWIQMGTLTEPKGGVAFIGPTSNTHTTYNNKIDLGIYMGMFMEGMDTPGQALLRGRLNMYNIFGDVFWVEYHYRVYHILGDPSIHIWKEVPESVNVVHPTTIPVGYSQQAINVTFAAGGLPVDSAQVCLSGENIFVTGYTDNQGNLAIPITPLLPDTLTITVRGKRVIPYQGTILVEQTNEHVAPDGEHIAVDINGSVNGSINPNENVNISFALKNWGTSTSENVQATITSSDTNVVVVFTPAITFGDIAAGSSVMGDPIEIFVKPYCPVGHIIEFDINVTSNTGSWTYNDSDTVKGCDLIYTDYLVVDTTAIQMNYRMDPGETVKLYLTVANIGEDLANSVDGILSCNDPWITVGDDHGSFGTILQGQSKQSANNFFEVTIDPLCPGNYMAEYSLHLYTQGNLYPYQNDLTFYIPVSMLSQSDFTGPDNYGYYAYTSYDEQFEQAPEYEWFEISQIGTQLNPTSSEYTETVDLPFNFKYYGIEYQQVRISTDGWIAFGGGNQTMYENAGMPSNNSVNSMVAVLWDDLYAQSNESGEMYYYSDTTNNRFIIEFDAMGHWGDASMTETFQILLLDTAAHQTPTGDGEIVIMYNTIANLSGCTIGIENHNQDDGIQYVFNNLYDTTANYLKNECALKFTTEPPYIQVNEMLTVGQVPSMTNNTLDQNYPNPFNSSTWITYSVTSSSNVNLSVYDVKGQLIRTLYNGNRAVGKYTINWDAKDNSGNSVSPGMYFYRLQADGFDKAMKMFKL